ncbi:MAG: type II toxin-antitoxin system VapC family toxin [Candidatus Acidiferrum sp.]
MIRYLIDTNVVSEVRKNKPHGAALAWMQDLELEQVFFSAVTFGEIQRGIELTRKQNPVKANEIEVWAAQLERSSKVLPMDSACFREYARLMHKRSQTLAEDAMIAATARVHGLTVATRNERDFRHLSVAVLNPFKVGKPHAKE